MFCASGAAALVYQVAWQRILALHSGVSVESVALITGAFMAGLGLGSHAGGRLSARVSARAALPWFAALELAVGVCGAASPVLFYDLLYARGAALYGNAWSAGLLHFASLLVPTTLMGMSLPLLVRAMVVDAASAGRTVGLLYGLNVLGAALGAILTPWLLIRRLGIEGALFAGAGANLLSAALALLLWRAGGRVAAEPSAPAAGEVPLEEPIGSRPFALWLGLYAATGFCALGLEILWFRLVEVAVKATAFTFGTVLAVYLLGLGGGSLAGTLALSRVRRPLRVFLLAQCALVGWALAAVLVLVKLPPDTPGYAWYVDYWGQRVGFTLGSAQDTGALLRLYLALPLFLYGVPTLLMGFAFTILQRAVHDDARFAGRRVGTLQAANIAGCLLGSLLVGLVLLQSLGSAGSFRVLGLAGIGFALLGLRFYGARSFLAPAALLVALAFALPGGDALWRRLHGERRGQTLAEEDASSVIALTELGEGEWRLFVNGRSHSRIPYGGVHTELGALPALLHPDPRDVAVVGLGSGDTAWAASCREETRALTVFEICAPQQRVLRRMLLLDEQPRVLDLLDDPRLRLVTADGRHRLRLEPERRYDVVEADALPPESAYSGNLYSLEFFELVAERLKPGGYLCSWAPTPRVAATLRAVFPTIVSCRDGAILVASRGPIPLDPDVLAERLAGARGRLRYRNAEAVREALQTCRLSPTAEPPDPRRLNRDLFPRDEFGSDDAAASRP